MAHPGGAVPWSTSLLIPREDRQTHKVALVSLDDNVVGLEFEWLTDLLPRYGVKFEHIDGRSKAAIQRAYEDGSFDVLWFSGHGDFSGRQVENAKMPIHEGGAIGLRDMCSWVIPDGLRRLLVLNVCYGGASPFVGGMGEFGFGARLTSPCQAVVSHLWNVDWMVAAVFGALLSGGLVESSNYHKSFAQTLGFLHAGRETMVYALAEYGLWDAGERCERLAADLESLAHWGSPVFFV